MAVWLPLTRITGVTAVIGDFWKVVVNCLGDRPITSDVYVPLIESVLLPFESWTELTYTQAKFFRTDTGRRRILADVARARLAEALWADHQRVLLGWARGQVRISLDALRRAWFSASLGRYHLDLWDRAEELFRALPLTTEDRLVLLHYPGNRLNVGPTTVADLIRDLKWIGELDNLRRIARKAWPARRTAMDGWDEADLAFVNGHYRWQDPELTPSTPPPFDPQELFVWNGSPSHPNGGDGLAAVMLALVHTAVVDLADELIETGRRPARGSLSCLECGKFVGRSALGVGQLYCDVRCKRRAAKRRNRESARRRHLEARSVAGMGGGPDKDER
jgi:hypothetical protein